MKIRRIITRAVSIILVLAMVAGMLVFERTAIRVNPGQAGSDAERAAMEQLLLASKYASSGRLERMKMYTEALLSGRRDTAQYIVKSQIALTDGDFEGALDFTKQALEHSKEELNFSVEEQARLCQQYGYLCVLLQRPAEAQDYIAQGAEVTGDADAYLVLSMLAGENGSTEECARSLEAYLSLSAEIDEAAGTIALLTGDTALIEKAFTRLYEAEPTAEHLLYRGCGRYAQGKRAEAMKDLNAYVTMQGEESAAYELCGLNAMREKDYKSALDFFTKGMEKVNADRKGCLYCLALSHYSLGEYEAAAADAESWFACENEESTALFDVNLPQDEAKLLTCAGISCERLGRHEEADGYLDRALVLDGENESLRFTSVGVKMALEKWQEALDGIAGLKEPGVSARYMKAVCLYELGSREAAEAEFEFVIDAEADEALLEQCRSYLRMINAEQAEETK